MDQYRTFIPGLILVLVLALAAPLSGAAEDMMTFREALMRMASQGRALKIAQKGQDIAGQDVLRARSPLLPQVNANAGRQYYAYQPASLASGQKLYTSQKDFNFAGVSVSQTLYDFGVNTSNLKSMRKLEDAAAEESVRARNQGMLEFISAYFDVLELNKLLAVAREEMVSLASHVHDIAIFYREGVVTKNEFLSAQVRFVSARQKMIGFKNQRKIAQARLLSILSIDEKEGLNLEDPAVIPDKNLGLEEAQASALTKRSELKIMNHAMAASKFREQSSRASNYPSVFADGGYSYAANRYQASDDNWSVKLGLKFNVFNGGLTRAETGKEKSRREQMREQIQKMEEDIRVEVAKAYWDLKTAGDKINLSRSAMTQARENVRVSRVQYKEGEATSTAVLDAIALLTGAETDFWRGVYEQKRAWAKLLYVMGCDLKQDFLREK